MSKMESWLIQNLKKIQLKPLSLLLSRRKNKRVLSKAAKATLTIRVGQAMRNPVLLAESNVAVAAVPKPSL